MTIVPVHISLDKTLITSFMGKSVYPVYVTIGNVPKEIRQKPSMCAQVLFAYLQVARLGHTGSSELNKCCVSQNLFHACMRQILNPLEAAGADGVLMKSSDNLVRWCHPILAIYAGDHPEQCLVSCTKTSDCPKGDPSGPLGENVLCRSHDINSILEALDEYDPIQQPKEYINWCTSMGVKPVINPFWKFLLYANIHQSITPDILHQLHQGVTKHLISWLQTTFGTLELDQRLCCLPLNHNIQNFLKGISNFS